MAAILPSAERGRTTVSTTEANSRATDGWTLEHFLLRCSFRLQAELRGAAIPPKGGNYRDTKKAMNEAAASSPAANTPMPAAFLKSVLSV
jgi:hypothetical protein